MKKLFLILIILFFIAQPTFAAISIDEAKEAFNTFLHLSNHYKKEVSALYNKDSKIKRILLLKDGTQKEIVLDNNKYKKKILFYRRLAMIIRYKLKFTEVNYIQEGDNVRVQGFRRPFAKKEVLPFEILFGEDENGIIRIKEELFYTRSTKYFKEYLKKK